MQYKLFTVLNCTLYPKKICNFQYFRSRGGGGGSCGGSGGGGDGVGCGCDGGYGVVA